MKNHPRAGVGYHRGTRQRSGARDLWLRRLRRTFLAVPAAVALTAVGLTGMFARHDAVTTGPSAPAPGQVHSPTSSRAGTTSVQPGSDDGIAVGGDDEGDDHGDSPRHHTVRQPTTPGPTLTTGGARPPITHTGGS